MKKTLVLLILSISLAICLAACDGPVEHTHQYGEWSVTERPTDTKEGLQERICSCGERESETIAKLPAGYSVGLDYKLNEDGQSYSVSGIGDCTDRILVISPVYNELPVTAINRSAFAGRKNLSSVVIPDGVTSIGESAFSRCTGLTSVVIPDSIVSIGNSAFYGCKDIRDVYISDLDAWYNISFGNQSSNPMCNGANLYLNGNLVTEVTVPDTVTTWGYTFTGCTSIVSATIPDSVTCIDKDAFRGCTGLESLVIPDSVTSIGDGAFYNCTGLTSVVIPDSVTRIGQNAFSGCDSLVYNEYDNAYYLASDLNPYLVLVKAKDTAITSCEINPNTKFMLDDAFEDCTSLASIVIPDSVASIGYAAFRDCTGLTSVVIGDGVTSIGYATFWGCTGLTSIVIPDGVTSIGNFAFRNCTGLTDVYYIGTEEEWAEISMDYYFNPSLEKATIHYSYAP